MISVAQYQQDYLLAWDESTSRFYLLFYTRYKDAIESVCIQLPSKISDQYINEGHSNLVHWIKRINEDYQVGRFSKDNPRLMMEYILAADEQKVALINCFENKISLIEQEALRLLYLIGDVERKIYHEMTQGKSIPIEIFCLAFKFYYSDKPLLDHTGKLLLDKADAASGLEALKNNSVYGCPDAALMLLGSLTRQKGSAAGIIHLKCLHNIINEPNCRYLRSRLTYYLEKAEKFNNLTIKDPHSGYEKLLQEFENEFLPWPQFSLTNTDSVRHWSFMEDSLAWQHDYLTCLQKAFASHAINIERSTADNLLCLLSGRDGHWHSYSIGQSINYCPVDPSSFTKEAVAKPKFPAEGNEDFIVAVWQQYLHHFAKADYPTLQLKAVLNEFTLHWNRD